MKAQQFSLDPRQYGIPDRQQLVDLRIWDSHYHGFLTGNDPIKQHHEMMFYVERMGIERVISVDIGGTLQDPLDPKPHDREQLDILNRVRLQTYSRIRDSLQLQSKVKRVLSH